MPKEGNYQITKKLNEKRLQELCFFFKSHNLQELELKEGDLEIIIKTTEPTVASQAVVSHITSDETTETSTNKETEAIKSKEDGNAVTAPISGNFYSSPSPNDPPYIKVGDKVKKGNKLCIIEAMKVMNEIPAPFSGTVSSILIENGKPVKQGDPIIIIIK